MDTESDPELLRTKLNLETAQIAWRELQRLFAGGKVVAVDGSLDLVAVAYAFAIDDRERVAGWMENGSVQAVTDDQALAWYAADAQLWAVVVRPFVLVQDRTGHAPDALK